MRLQPPQPILVVDLFPEILDALLSLLGDLSADAEPAPVWLDLAREYTERWCHQQQIRDAVGKRGLTQPRYLAPVLAAFMWALPRTFRATPAAEGTVVTLTIHGASGGQWSVRQEEDTWRLYEGAPNRRDAEVLVDEEIAWRLCTRGLSQEQVRAQVTFVGDQILASQVCAMVSIIA
jgi:hypothetical protein